jgi:hypothetical protein
VVLHRRIRRITGFAPYDVRSRPPDAILGVRFQSPLIDAPGEEEHRKNAALMPAAHSTLPGAALEEPVGPLRCPQSGKLEAAPETSLMTRPIGSSIRPSIPRWHRETALRALRACLLRRSH